jgi:hypothetical protein
MELLTRRFENWNRAIGQIVTYMGKMLTSMVVLAVQCPKGKVFIRKDDGRDHKALVLSELW